MIDTPQRNTGENTILLPTPVAVLQHRESKFSVLARFFAWITACMLSISVLVALVSVTSERDNLQAQLSCRATATLDVNRAITNEQIALADHSVLVGKFITILIQTTETDPARQPQLDDLGKDIIKVDAVLDQIGVDLREAVQQQAVSLQSC